jgi:hypothetical protein
MLEKIGHDKTYVGLLFLIPVLFGAVDFSMQVADWESRGSRIALGICAALALCLVLYARTVHLRLNPLWAAAGLVPPLGLAVGIGLYFVAPRQS